MDNAVIYFEYNGKTYFATLINNKMHFFIKENNMLLNRFSSQDKEIISGVLNYFNFEEKNKVYIKQSKHDNQLFNLYYDKKLDLYYTDSKLASINSYINKSLNNVSSLYYLKSKNENESEKYIRRVIKIGSEIIVVLILAETIIAYINKFTPVEVAYIFDNAVYSSFNQKEFEYTKVADYDFNVIKDAVLSNKNLTQDEKDLILNLKFIFDENYKYMDIEKITHDLKKLHFKYDTNPYENPCISGVYNPGINAITIYNATSLDDSNIACVIHEIMHIFQNNAVNNLSFELSNEFYTREATRRLYDNGYIPNDKLYLEYADIAIYGLGYQPYMPLHYVLAELVSKEALMEYQFTGNQEVIVNELIKLDNNETNYAYLYFSTLNQVKVGLNDTIGDYQNDILNDCYSYLNYYYNKKYNKNIQDDLVSTLYFYNTLGNYDFELPVEIDLEHQQMIDEVIINNLPKDIKQKNNLHFGHDTFGYLRYVACKDYINDSHNQMIVTFTSPSMCSIVIDDAIQDEYTNLVNKKIK